MKRRISEELKDEIRMIRETALQVRDEMDSPTMKARIDLALLDLDEIPRLFETEDAMRKALIVPNARIREVVRIRDSHGRSATFLPE